MYNTIGIPIYSNSEPLIEMRDVVKTYHSEAGNFTALKGIDLQVYPGEFLGIIGKSGAGKSTLLNMITGVDHLTAGEVIIRAGGKPISIHKLGEDKLALWRGRAMGVVYQSFQLLPMLTLLENIMLPMDLCNLYHPRESYRRAMELLELVEIPEHGNKLPNFISGGQQQRVAIARALANDPEIVVADEPTGSLDSVTADHIFDVFEHLVQNGKTIVMVTHDMGLAARFSRHYLIADGEIVPESVSGLDAELEATAGESSMEQTFLRFPTDKQAASPSWPSSVPGSASEAIIDLRKIVKKFKNAAGEFTVLKGVDLQIGRGEFVSIVGKSGSGKSTLLNMVTGIDHPSAGQVIVNGQDLYTSLSESDRSLWRGKNLGIVFQFFQLLPMLSLVENVMLPMDYADLYDFDERPKRAMDLLTMVGLENFAHKHPHAVSTGQQQLAAIARALATNPPLLVADEPTGNLDSRSSDNIITLFDHLVSEGKTVVMVTHDPSVSKRTIRNIIISDGEMIDETVAKALPQLQHRQMLAVTKKAQRLTFGPGQPILQRDGFVDSFFMIAHGKVEIVLQDKNNVEILVGSLVPGQYFGEVELLNGGKSIAGIRAAKDTPAELLVLARKDFQELLKESPHTEESLAQNAQRRLEENEAIIRRVAFETT